MEKYSEDTQRALERYQELYEQDPELRVTAANREGDISLLNDTFFIKKELNILDVTLSEKWNWLHRCNLNSYAPAPLSVVEFYIKYDVPINAQDIYGMTPLHYALRSKNAEAAIALLEAGANPNLPNRDRLIPLSMIGYIPNRLDVLELMLKKGANVHYLVNDDETILESYKPTESEPELKPIYDLMEKYSKQK